MDYGRLSTMTALSAQATVETAATVKPLGAGELALIVGLSLGLAVVHFLPSVLETPLLDQYSDGWVAVTSGITVAYVFVDVLPEIHEVSELATATAAGVLASVGTHVYVLSLLGFLTHHVLEKAAVDHHHEATGLEPGVFWLRVGLRSLFNGVVGLMLAFLHVFFETNHYLLFFVAIAIHFFVGDYGLFEEAPGQYVQYARWFAAASLVVGTLVGLLARWTMPVAGVDATLFFAFLAGGIIYDAFSNELPTSSESRAALFTAAALVYGTVLVFV